MWSRIQLQCQTRGASSLRVLKDGVRPQAPVPMVSMCSELGRLELCTGSCLELLSTYVGSIDTEVGHWGRGQIALGDTWATWERDPISCHKFFIPFSLFRVL